MTWGDIAIAAIACLTHSTTSEFDLQSSTFHEYTHIEIA
jgi:hypothetical protein